MHAQRRGCVVARGEERIPVTGVDTRQAKVRGNLAKTDPVNPPSGVGADLLGGYLGVPQRYQPEGYEAAGRVPAPLVHHPVVVGPYARHPELAVLRGFVESLSAEP